MFAEAAPGRKLAGPKIKHTHTYTDGKRDTQSKEVDRLCRGWSGEWKGDTVTHINNLI